jgi:hypothetical protein
MIVYYIPLIIILSNELFSFGFQINSKQWSKHAYEGRVGFNTMRLANSQSDHGVESEFERNLENEDYEKAYQVLKRNPMLHISKEDGRVLLNNLDQLDPSNNDFEKEQKKVITVKCIQPKALIQRLLGCRIECLRISTIRTTEDLEGIWMH